MTKNFQSLNELTSKNLVSRTSRNRIESNPNRGRYTLPSAHRHVDVSKRQWSVVLSVKRPGTRGTI